MSVDSWIREHVGSIRAATKSDVAAIEHALRRYEATKPDALRKHNVTLDFGVLEGRNGARYEFGASECAMCSRYMSGGCANNQGVDCPLKPACYPGKKNESTYGTFLNNTNPYPMIATLKKALRIAKKKEQRDGTTDG